MLELLAFLFAAAAVVNLGGHLVAGGFRLSAGPVVVLVPVFFPQASGLAAGLVVALEVGPVVVPGRLVGHRPPPSLLTLPWLVACWCGGLDILVFVGPAVVVESWGAA